MVELIWILVKLYSLVLNNTGKHKPLWKRAQLMHFLLIVCSLIKVTLKTSSDIILIFRVLTANNYRQLTHLLGECGTESKEEINVNSSFCVASRGIFHSSWADMLFHTVYCHQVSNYVSNRFSCSRADEYVEGDKIPSSFLFVSAWHVRCYENEISARNTVISSNKLTPLFSFCYCLRKTDDCSQATAQR